MPSRKRTLEEVDEVNSSTDSIPEEMSTLQRIRGMWEFTALMQYLFFFGKAVKVEDLDVEDFEDECLKPGPSERLNQIALALLKHVSSHRGLTPELLDEYTRRQYLAKAPKRNPFGDDETPREFASFDVFTKIRVLNQLAIWTLNNPNSIREKMEEQTEREQTNWRIEPMGWDNQDRTYYIFDDSRLYRQTDAPPPSNVVPRTPKQPKSKKTNGRSTRSTKRRRVGRRVIETSPEETEEEHDATSGAQPEEARLDDFFMQSWELVAVTFEEYKTFVESLRKSRDPNEKALVKRIQDEVYTVLEQQEEARQRKEARRLKELEIMQKLASSKRSGRLAQKQEKVKLEAEAEEAERKRQADIEMARKEMRRQQEAEEARESRRETRDQRLREREVKKILEEERLRGNEALLKELEEKEQSVVANQGRLSQRQLKAEVKRRKKELESLQTESWYFDCICGVHGENLDDGTHSIACDKCSTWQHSTCNNIAQSQAERDDFHFVCQDCKHKEENPVKLKLKMGSPPQSVPIMNGSPVVEIPKKKIGRPKKEPDEIQPAHVWPTTSPKTLPKKQSEPLVHSGAPPNASAQNNGHAAHTNGNAAVHTAQASPSSWHSYHPTTGAFPAYAPQGQPSKPHQPEVSAASSTRSYAPQSHPQSPPRYAGAPLQPSQAPQQRVPTPASNSTSRHYSPSGAAAKASQSPQSNHLQQTGHRTVAPTDQGGPINTGAPSPSKRPISAGTGHFVPPTSMVTSVAANGSAHSKPIPTAAKSSQSPPPASHPLAAQSQTLQTGQFSTPAPQRAPAHVTLQPSLTPSQNQHTAPGYSPTKQSSPSIASSPFNGFALQAQPIVSPPTHSAAHFSPPKPVTSFSPVKQLSSPVQQQLQASVSLHAHQDFSRTSGSPQAMGPIPPLAASMNPMQTVPKLSPSPSSGNVLPPLIPASDRPSKP